MKKRIGAFLLSLVMVFGLTATAFAAVVIPSINKNTIEAGEDVDVILTLDEQLQDVTCFDYRVYFDENLFDLVKGTNGVGNPNTQNSRVKTDEIGRFHQGAKFISVNFVDTMSEGQIVHPGTLYTLTFRAKKEISEEVNYTFRVYKVTLSDTTFEPIPGAEVSGGELHMTVKPAQKNGYTATLTPQTQSANYGATARVALDVNGKGFTKYNAADVTLTYDAAKLTFNKEASALNGFEVKDSGGKLHLVAYGADRKLGEALSLAFDTKAVGTAAVTLNSAKLDDGVNASAQDAPEAVKGNTEASIVVDGYSVVLPNEFTGPAVAEPNKDYTFTAKDQHYHYTFDGSTMGGTSVPVKDNGDGTFTVSHVTGPIVIVSNKTAMTYDVTVQGTGAGDVTAEKKAAYMSDYTFTLQRDANYNYDVTVTVGGKTCTEVQVQENSYTIPGAAVTGPVVITVHKTENPANVCNVTFAGNGAGDAKGNPTVMKNSTYQFEVKKAEGYDYTVTATVNGKAVPVRLMQGQYRIAPSDVTGDIVITIDKKAACKVDVTEYVKLDGKTMFLVTVTGNPGADKTYAYDDVPMFYSEKYQAYCWLVISDGVFNSTTAQEHIAAAAAKAVPVVYDNDINGTQQVDVNDAQMTYNMYNAQYADFTAVAMDKFLKADVNGSRNLTVEDAAAIVNGLLNS